MGREGKEGEKRGGEREGREICADVARQIDV